jgi:hypothetical protein
VREIFAQVVRAHRLVMTIVPDGSGTEAEGDDDQGQNDDDADDDAADGHDRSVASDRPGASDIVNGTGVPLPLPATKEQP